MFADEHYLELYDDEHSIDEDAPELSLEQMRRYRKAAIDKKAKAVGQC